MNKMRITIILFKKKKFRGEYINDIWEGTNIYYFKCGNRYEYQYKNNQREGKRIFIYNNNGDKPELNLREGEGIPII